MPSAHRSHATRPRKRGSPRRHQADRGFDRGVGSGLGLQRKHRKARDARRGLVVVPVQRDELAHVNPPLGSHVVTLLVTARGALGCDLAVVHPLFMFKRLAVHFGQRNSRTLPACRVLRKGRGPVMWGTRVRANGRVVGAGPGVTRGPANPRTGGDGIRHRPRLPIGKTRPRNVCRLRGLSGSRGAPCACRTWGRTWPTPTGRGRCGGSSW